MSTISDYLYSMYIIELGQNSKMFQVGEFYKSTYNMHNASTDVGSEFQK